MSEFTYEREHRDQHFETYEWDNTWIDHANDRESKRVFYIGDSISCGIRRFLQEQGEGKFRLDLFGTSRGIDNASFKEALLLWAKQAETREAILINNGLHGWHLNDETEYRMHYAKMLDFLKEQFPGTPIAIVLTTHIAEEKSLPRVHSRNKVNKELAKEYNLPVIDLYRVSLENKNLLSQDGIHFTPEGYAVLAKEILDSLKTIAPKLFNN